MPNHDVVREYYDDRVEEKLRDFTNPNPRIEVAIETLAEWAPPNPKRILEIGCGIGATAWRMARAWPNAQVLGLDISPLSIEVARTCFKRDNLDYRVGVIAPGTLERGFDLVVLMDVYEHIQPSDRPALHDGLRSALSDESRVIMSVPTPAMLDDLARHDPDELQPVDEHITVDEIAAFAKGTNTRHLYYRTVGVWRYGDYAHHVFGRFRELADVAIRKTPPKTGRKAQIRRVLGVEKPTALRDYLGDDFGRRRARHAIERFAVSRWLRRKQAARWTSVRSKDI